MKTKTINVYSFDELNEKAKEHAIDACRYWQVEHDWWEYIYEDADQIGLKIDGFDLDRNRHAKGTFTLSACEVAQNIINNHGESCSTHKTASDFLDRWQPVFNDYMDEDSPNYESAMLEGVLLDMEDGFCDDLLEEYSIMIQKDYEYYTSDESVIEFILANDYKFLEDGSLS